MTPTLLSADSLVNTDVHNLEGENIGTVTNLMIDIDFGKIAYAVLSFGGFMGLGDKLFAIPWSSLTVDTETERFVLNVDKTVLESAEGFDQDDWPDWSDLAWNETIYTTFGATPYWQTGSGKAKQ